MCCLPLQVIELVLQVALLVQKARQRTGQFLPGGFEDLGQSSEEILVFLKPGIGSESRQSLDSTNACRDAGFADNLKHPDISGELRVRSAAELLADLRDRNHSHLLSIPFAEKR